MSVKLISAALYLDVAGVIAVYVQISLQEKGFAPAALPELDSMYVYTHVRKILLGFNCHYLKNKASNEKKNVAYVKYRHSSFFWL